MFFKDFEDLKDLKDFRCIRVFLREFDEKNTKIHPA